MRRIWLNTLVAAVFCACQAGIAAAVDLTTINAAELNQRRGKAAKGFDPAIVKAQVLLDRAGFSPGEIDGRMGENFKKALNAFASARNLRTSSQLTPELWAELTVASDEPVVVEYAITERDVKGPFLKKVPARMEDMRGLDHLGYGSAGEALAEKFHMSETLLKNLNRGVSFDAGQTIVVANVTDTSPEGRVTRIEVDKSHRVLRAFAKSGYLVAVFPATIGSKERPAPSGTHRVTSVSRNPTYRYNPDFAFKGVKSKEAFVINPGPNNPVGSVWIALSAKSYGIHGTPNPSQVGKTESHGCVRLTNWDAKKLATMVAKGTTVEFVGDESSGRTAAANRRRR
jgi:lipoprotein-anchoring transpeptidase ErfK/SrfK